MSKNDWAIMVVIKWSCAKRIDSKSLVLLIFSTNWLYCASSTSTCCNQIKTRDNFVTKRFELSTNSQPLTPKVANGGWVPRDPGAATANTHQGGRAPSDQYNPQPSHEFPAPPPITPVTQKPKGPVETNQRRKTVTTLIIIMEKKNKDNQHQQRK